MKLFQNANCLKYAQKYQQPTFGLQDFKRLNKMSLIIIISKNKRLYFKWRIYSLPNIGIKLEIFEPKHLNKPNNINEKLYFLLLSILILNYSKLMFHIIIFSLIIE